MERALTFTLLLAILATTAHTSQRTLRSWLNPGCEEKLCDEKNITTVHLRADGPNDTLHYLWDFTGKPSVLLALTHPSATLNITWDDFIAKNENSVRFSIEPVYTYGVVINKIIEFNDLADTAAINFTDKANLNMVQPEYFDWSRQSFTASNEFAGVDVEGNWHDDVSNNIARHGSIKLSLKGFSTLDRSSTVPHMLHTENSTQFDIVLDGLRTNSTFANSRYAFEVLIVDGGTSNAFATAMTVKKSLDDEHTPGIFEVIEVKTIQHGMITETRNGVGAYLQWRPVSYTTAHRDVTSATETMQYPLSSLPFNRTEAMQNTLLHCYYGERVNDFHTDRIVVSLGTKGDGFYKSSNYSTWTFLIGYGDSPDEQFSYLVIMIISIGIGLPVLILLSVGIYLCVRRSSKRRSDEYENR